MTAARATSAVFAADRESCQTTLAEAVVLSGRGLHTGCRTSVRVNPASADTGLVFRRVDRGFASPDIPARWDRVYDNTACTALRNESGASVRTVEHLLAALYACDITNALVEVDGPEIPILDGSARPLIATLKQDNGLRLQPRPRRRLQVLKTLAYRQGRTMVRLEPADRFEIDLTISLRHVGRQRWCGVMRPETLAEEIAAARSFGRAGRVLAGMVLGRLGLLSYMRGAGLDNVLAIARDRPLNRGGFRMSDEPVRHRVLDAVGDLMLLGAPPLGRFVAESTSHAATCRLLGAFMSDADAWCWTDAPAGSNATPGEGLSAASAASRYRGR